MLYIGFQCFTQSSGSLYSAYGIGNIRPAAVGAAEGMGYTGIGVRSPFFVNTTNPAANVFMQSPTTMMLDAGIYGETTYARNRNEHALQGGGGLSHLVLWMQPSKYWGTTLGLMPFSEVKYNIGAERYNEILDDDYTVAYQGAGGLNRFFWSNAFRPVKNLSLGMEVSFLFGAIERKENFRSTGALGSFSTLTKTNFSDVILKAGLQYSFRLRGNQLILGATFQPGSAIATSENSWLYKDTEELEQTEESEESYQLPLQTGFGISWQSKRLLLASDITFQQWSDKQLNTNSELQNTTRASLGVEWALTESSYLFYQQPLLLRTGFFVQNHPQIVEENAFLVWGFSAGISVPIRRKLHHLSVNYSFQQRGTLADDLLLESVHRLTFNINLRDIWFQKQRFN